MKFRRVHIAIQNSSKAVHLQMPEWVLGGLTLAKRIVQLGILLFILQIGTMIGYRYLSDYSSRDRVRLYNELQNLGHQLDTVSERIGATFANEDLLYLKFGSPPPEEELRTLGFGGYQDPDSVFVHSVHPIRGLRNEITEKVGHFHRQISRSDSSFEFIGEQMNQQYAKWRHIPSVSPCNGRYSSVFGLRTHPVTGERSKMHYGIDISNKLWTPIYAPADGRVTLVRNGEFFGNYVVLDHANGYVTKYGHMVKPIVKIGQFVKRYQILGYMGRTGRTTGVHLHYEVHHNDTPIDPINFVLPAFASVE